MPAKGSAARDAEYKENLEGLEEILHRYQTTHHVVVAGDFNASYFANPPDTRDNIFRSFLERNHLSITEGHPRTPTYTKPDGTECSSLDYILTDSKTSSQDTRVVLDPLDTSDHYPVHADILLTPDLNPQITHNPGKPRSSGSWAKVDLNKYRELLDEQLSCANLPDNITSQYDAVSVLNKATKIMVSTKNRLAPCKKSAARNRKSNLQPKWTPAMAMASKIKKKAFHVWKQAGRPQEKDNLTLLEHKKSKKKFRQVQRKQVANKYREDMESIAEARKVDSRMFHKLVKLRSNTRKAPQVPELIVEGTRYIGEDVIKGWARHFSKLARPKLYCDDYAADTQTHVSLLTNICKSQKKGIPSTTTEQLKKAIERLNLNKAADANGLVTEHLKHSPDSMLDAVTMAMNYFTRTAKFPDTHKNGLLFPAHKKLEICNPYNHRGITIVNLFCKLYEITLKTSTDPVLLPSQSKMQRGFTTDTPALLSGLMIQEQIYQAKRECKPLYITLLDVKTAFDVVWHASLLKKLHKDGIDGDLWLAIRDLYTNATSQVSWKGQTSDPFTILQGVRQGAVLSSDLYKRFNNPLLEMLCKSQLGGYIGTTPLPAPSCADDVALCSTDPGEMQSMIDVIYRYSCQEKYEIQPRKSAVLIVNDPNPSYPFTFYMGDNPIPNVDEGTHLGVLRNKKGGPETQVQHNITCARKAAYHLMGAGMHGKNGLPHQTSTHLYQIYILPILVYGLSIFSLEDNHLTTIERFQKSIIKQILSLADNTADPAVYILSGTAPLEFEIHRQALSLFGSICRHPDSAEYELARRQLLVEPYDSEDWFCYIRRLCSKYDLPPPATLLDNPPTKSAWKATYDRHLKDYWSSYMLNQAEYLKKARFLNPQAYCIGKTHPIIRHASIKIKDVQKCTVKLQLITGSYLLQAHRAKFNQFEVKADCLLCGNGPENRTHFLVECSALQERRAPHISMIKDILERNSDEKTAADMCDDPDTCTALILDCTSQAVTGKILLPKNSANEIEIISQRLIFSLHIGRKSMLQLIAPSLARKRGKTNVKTISLQQSLHQQHLQVATQKASC